MNDWPRWLIFWPPHFEYQKGKRVVASIYHIPIFPSVTKLSLLLSSSSWSSLAGHCLARRSWPRRVAWFSAQFSNTWETCPPGHPLHSTYNLDFTTWSRKIANHKTCYLKSTPQKTCLNSSFWEPHVIAAVCLLFILIHLNCKTYLWIVKRCASNAINLLLRHCARTKTPLYLHLISTMYNLRLTYKLFFPLRAVRTSTELTDQIFLPPLKHVGILLLIDFNLLELKHIVYLYNLTLFSCYDIHY